MDAGAEKGRLRQQIESLLRHGDKKVYEALRDEAQLLKIYVVMQRTTLDLGRWLWGRMGKF